MKAGVQRVSRVSRASVAVEGDTVGSIGRGLLVLIGAEKGDADDQAVELADKVSKLRIFPDDEDKMNLSVQDVNGSALVVSQFTLAADVRKGTRPSFDAAEQPDRARQLIDLFVGELRSDGIQVQEGRFGAHMEVSLVNDGPVTILMESKAL